MTWFEFRENDTGSFDVVMLKGHPEDETNQETIVATGLDEVDAEADAEWRNECARDAVDDYAREMANPEFDRSGGHY